jgi:hypothetical protein
MPDGCGDTKYRYVGGAANEFVMDQTLTISGKYSDCDSYFFELDKKIGFLSPDRKTIMS